MTDAAKASVWDVVWAPWGSAHSISGSATLDTRFPGQWYQLESGLHYNWHRHYDPTLGRYTQPDPLGFVDGPSVYGYAGSSPQRWVDRDGLWVGWSQLDGSWTVGGGPTVAYGDAYDSQTGTITAYASAGMSAGVDVGGGWTIGYFGGSICDFKGSSVFTSISIIWFSVTVFKSGDYWGFGVGPHASPFPFGASGGASWTKLLGVAYPNGTTLDCLCKGK